MKEDRIMEDKEVKTEVTTTKNKNGTSKGVWIGLLLVALLILAALISSMFFGKESPKKSRAISTATTTTTQQANTPTINNAPTGPVATSTSKGSSPMPKTSFMGCKILSEKEVATQFKVHEDRVLKLKIEGECGQLFIITKGWIETVNEDWYIQLDPGRVLKETDRKVYFHGYSYPGLKVYAEQYTIRYLPTYAQTEWIWFSNIEHKNKIYSTSTCTDVFWFDKNTGYPPPSFKP